MTRPERVLVCSACGSPNCAAGVDMCQDALRADVAPCTCEWMHVAGNATGGARPLIIDPGCYVHGEPS